MSETVLVIAPHADDEVLGCGGTIARHVDIGHEVHVLVVTRGHPALFPAEVMNQVHKEMYVAHKLLGVKSTQVLDFPAPQLDMVPGYKLADALSSVIRRVNAKTVYVPHRGDLHADHEKVYTAALVAARPINGCPVKRVLVYETLSETDWASPSSQDAFVPTLFVNISDFIELKLQAMQCYQSQLKPYPNTRSIESLRALARLRGCVEGQSTLMLLRPSCWFVKLMNESIPFAQV